MPFAKTEHLSGSTELVSFPSLVKDDGTYNDRFIPELGEYFEDHFAFRPQLVTANAVLRNILFKDSGTDQVVVGKNGFYFFSGTMDDYLGKNDLSDRDLKSIANNLAIMQNYVESNGSKFGFTISPNKNTLYPYFMPYYYLQTQKQHNIERLQPYLEQKGVHYIDMFKIFDNEDVNYLKEDSHWSNKGALKAANTLLPYFDKEPLYPEKWVARNDRDGDIYAMMYPSIIGKEKEDYAVGYNDKNDLCGDNWKFNKGKTVEDSLVITNSNSDKSLYMYRDSFANALIPYLSSVYGKAFYSKLIPYDMVAAVNNKSNDVLIERAERHLSYLCEKAPLMPSPIVDVNNVVDSQDSNSSTLQYEKDNNYINLFGTIDFDIFNKTDKVFLEVEGPDNQKTYQAFCLKDNTYCVRINKNDFSNITNAKILLEQNSCVYKINEYNFSIK
ncbi:MAG: hypothetical protein Q4E88_06220 [Coriobacteriia bacterium]|nr:hypothetical protein [Coriobacteriia bacterium]